jgi:hypothetical protein
MAGIQDVVTFEDDFFGAQTVSATPSEGAVWDITDTSSSGTPTYTIGGINGELTLAFDNTSEIQNVCLATNDILNFDIDLIQRFECRLKQGQATIDTTTQMAWGLASARNDAIDTIAHAALFRIIGTNAVVVETDDAVNNNDDVATGKTLANAYKEFVIDFTGGKSNVKFYIDGARVAASTTFDMSNYSSGLQPYFQIQKTADTNTDSLVIDYVKVLSKRS